MPRRNENKTVEVKVEDLVYLVYGYNNLTTRLLASCPEEISLDLHVGTWTWKESTHHIGLELFFTETAGAPIGVFDRTRVDHLQSLLQAQHHVTATEFAKKIQRSRDGAL